MSKALRMRCVWGLGGVLAGVLALASVARAEVSTDISGSVLVWAKVVYDGQLMVNSQTNGLPPPIADESSQGRDTIIQVSNTSNNMVHAHCFYVNGAPDAFGTPLWQVTDFTIWLTRQQPTYWVASTGRAVNPADGFGSPQSGLDPGLIPPVPPGFTGELKCVQIDASGTPFGGNNLKGEAVIRSTDGDVSKYNAIAILANPDLAGDFPPNELLLNNTPANDGEYNACPDVLLLDHFVDGTPNPVITDLNPAACVGGDCPIRTYLTVIPCTQDFENAQSTFVTMQFAIINELEQVFSASTSVLCWRSTRLADIDAPTGRCTESGEACVTDAQCIEADEGFCNKNSVFSVGVLGTGSAYTRISPVDPFGGVLAVAEEYQYNNIDDGGDQLTRVARGAWNLQQQGNRYNPDAHVTDKITIPVFSGF